MTKHWSLLGSALVIAAVAGCGKDNEVATSQAGYRDANVMETSTRSSETMPTPAVSGSGLSAEEVRAEPVGLQPGSKAPDLLAKVSKETVARGETIDITAQGSSDVVEMILSDGYGTTQALQFDAESSTWKTAYRVPLNMRLDRLGLSIKAKNDDNRWRRVWVFLNLPENSVEKAMPDTESVGS